MKIVAVCTGLDSGRTLRKLFDLDGVPRSGDLLVVEWNYGAIVLKVLEVRWQEGKPTLLHVEPLMLGKTSFGDKTLDGAGWECLS